MYGPIIGLDNCQILELSVHLSFDAAIGANGKKIYEVYCSGNELNCTLVWTCPLLCSSQKRVPTTTPSYTLKRKADAL